MAEIKMPHPEHEKHLCYLENVGYLDWNLADYAALVREAKFVCGKCGRVAANEKNVCEPERL